MRATRAFYAVALGAASLVLAGSMAGAVAFAANGGSSGGGDESWTQGLGSGLGTMMGGGAGGMMGGGWGQWDSTDTEAISLDGAKELADAWVAAKQPGATTDAGRRTPMGYAFRVIRGGQVVARIMVNDDSGEVYEGPVGSGGMMGGGRFHLQADSTTPRGGGA